MASMCRRGSRTPPRACCHHRRHAGGQEGASRPDRRCARESAILEGPDARPEAPRTRGGAQASGRRRRARLLAGDRGSVAAEPRPTLLGAQDRQCAEQAAEEPAVESQAGLTGDLDGRNQKGCIRGARCLCRDLGVKYDKAVECLVKDRDALLAFYVSRPSTGNICARATLSKARSPPTALAMIFKLAEA